MSPTATRRRALAASMSLAVAAATGVVLAHGSSATPGDPLASWGTNGVRHVGPPVGCSPCPTADSAVTGSKLASGGSRTILGYDWTTPPPVSSDPNTPNVDAARAVQSSVLAVSDGGAAPWVVPLTSVGTGLDRSVLAVGWQPSPARVVAVARVVQQASTPSGTDTPLREEVRRYTTAGVLDATTTLDASANGSWSLAAVAGDGSVVGVEDSSSGAADLPLTTVRRYAAGGTLRWTKVLPAGDAVEQVTVDADGRIVLVGSRANQGLHTFDGLMTVLTDAGSLDPSFGTGGALVSPAPVGFGRSFVAVDSAGADAVAVGTDQRKVADPSADGDNLPGALVVARTRSGQLVSGFGSGGVAVRPWSASDGPRTEPSAVRFDGQQVVVAEGTTQPGGSAPTAALERFTATGAVDDGFQVDGSVAPGFTALERVAGGYVVATPNDPSAAAFGLDLRAYTTAPGPPAGPPAPGAPAIAQAAAGRVELSWSAPPGPVTGEEVLIDTGGDGGVDAVSHVAPTTSATVGGLAAGRAYRFAIRARNSAGISPRSAWSALALPPFRSVDAFTDRQYRDFALRAPTSAELTSWRDDITAGRATPLGEVDRAVDFMTWAPVQSPVIRLYKAYFKRLPDTGGLGYWVGRSRAGASLAAISDQFAASSEFQHTYGSLSNRGFVQLVYQNVLGRPGESSGVDYWTGQLDQHKRTRGAVMTGFSESAECKRITKPTVDVVNIYVGMLRRVPTAGEADLWTSLLARGSPRTDVIRSILSSSDYDSRIL
ncbi:MAG: hypothetical protein JWN46_2367 [Acidimicrobiales bacterium]|nr:hypothetical protein [Acidimicrobiales bacterium]